MEKIVRFLIAIIYLAALGCSIKENSENTFDGNESTFGSNKNEFILKHKAVDIFNESELDSIYSIMNPIFSVKLQKIFLHDFAGKLLYIVASIEDLKQTQEGYQVIFRTPLFNSKIPVIFYTLSCDKEIANRILSKIKYSRLDKFGIIINVNNIDKMLIEINAAPNDEYSSVVYIEASDHWICYGTLIDYVLISQ